MADKNGTHTPCAASDVGGTLVLHEKKQSHVRESQLM